MHPPAGLYFHFGSGATAFLAVTLIFLFLSGTTNGALRCIEDGTGSYSSAASNRVQQSVKPNGGNGGGGVASKDSLVKSSLKGTAATSNSIEQRQPQQQSNSNSMQRSYKTFSPIITRWKPYRTNGGTSSNGSTGFGSRASPAESIRQQKQQQQQQQQQWPQQRLMIPVGVSNYRPIQYVNDVKPGPFPRAYFDKVMATVFNRTSTSGGGGANTTGGSYSSSSVAASSDISEVKLNDAQSGGDNEVEVMHPSRAHPPRFIELESSYVPLTIRFPSRTSRLNIIENSGDTASNTVDLVGQDSNRHDSFGRRTGSSSPKGGTSGETSSSSKTAAAASVPSSSGVRNLEARVLFGDAKREEPLVLKQDGKTNIPDNMQRIIKCIFPDFKFDGAEKVQSAC